MSETVFVYPQISIIVPVYNAEMYLDGCIESIVNQTYTNFELILVNDGSKDASKDICNKWEQLDSRIRVFHKSNGGASSARNYGIENSNGEYIMFVDSDDTVAFDICEKLLENIRDDCSLVVCGLKTSFGNFVIRSENSVLSTDKGEIFNLLFENGILNSPVAKLFRRDCIGTLRFDPNMYMGEDLTFNLEYLSRIDGGVAVLPYCGYVYNRENNNSITHVFNPATFLQQKTVYKKTLEFSQRYVTSQNSELKISLYFFIDAKWYLQNVYFSTLSRYQKKSIAMHCIEDVLLQDVCTKIKCENYQDKVVCGLIKSKNEVLLSLFFKVKQFFRSILRH